MIQDIHYVVDALGHRVAVLLDLATYQRLATVDHDPDLLIGLSHDELTALANSVLSPESQDQLHDLLSRNAEEGLSEKELAILDQLTSQVDHLNNIKAKVRYTLEKLNQVSS
ncbi:hypothetical protein GFS31_08220 [Leptolyngbya sp. BL0902]|uniref:hypothetical protein n=1 Tax=Leptolyngbya sp. BL0902 TaxID=1115757 RepID=UPI0018E8E240|nr:hypothetical protein [Leptolyngbya sp. BL0902]QQE64143.1 hypothetical protein GFS31_08220 [Leptolyngbya sp. BL0902]